MTTMLSREALTGLLEPREGPCLSFFFGTRRLGPKAEKDRAHLKHLLSEAEQALVEVGSRPVAARELLSPVTALLEDGPFWQRPPGGTAIFLAPGFLEILDSPERFDERLELGERFTIAPLLPVLPAEERFFVLALSLKTVRLLEVTLAGHRRIEIPGLPEGVADSWGYDQFDTGLQYHSASPGGLGRQRAMAHGHGGGDEENRKKDIFNYFRQVAASITPRIPPEMPIVLAVVEALLPIYREASRTASPPELLIPGSPEGVPDQELAARGWEVVETLRGRRLEEALARYRELGRRERAVCDSAQAVEAAYHGRVETLFLVPESPIWGRYDPEQCQAEVHDHKETGDQDLTDLAAYRTLAHGGEILPVAAGAWKEEGPLAAILRY